ncbi:hypothetical protein [Microbulbifer sp. GL-2]|uniref:hypothetical protein n=1 Tax=Microbulbifer sp. GL-2 TaxID=2591606 RepID=UPI0011658EAA|nr:hypothetical protein [Microbulbifer sp. GL-2]BBM03097.1 hypothetical protein GL2_31710 [Microbulbifer sp. GL-2]
MSKALELAKYYFDLSNQSDFSEIEKIFDQSSTFCARDGVIYLGVQDIMAMQRLHHGSYSTLKWIVNEVEEVKPGIIRFDFDFEGTTQGGESVRMSGVEFVVVDRGIIRHIDVRSQ